MPFYPWPEIEAFHQVRKSTHKFPELLGLDPRVLYLPKVKLHGTNAAIQIHSDGTVIAQSRTNVITPQNDNMGFAAWVEGNKEMWALKGGTDGVVLYGEWCGRGIQSNVAVSEIPKTFAIFGARSIRDPDFMIVEPTRLEAFVPDALREHKIALVLPWAGPPIIVDWSKPSEELETITNSINEAVLAVEACDPWVEANFNVKGTGEGLVYYPDSAEHVGSFKMFGDLCFKAKGAKHRVVTAPKAATVDPQVAASTEAFVNMVVTEARLEQGAGLSGELDRKNTGTFVRWIISDVTKECGSELEASGLTWKQVSGQISARASKWWLKKCGL